MRKISVLFSLLLAIVCFAACKGNDIYLSEIESSTIETSSGFSITITDDANTELGEITSSELEQIASDWDKIEIEIEPEKPIHGVASSETTVGGDKNSSSTTDKTSSSSFLTSSNTYSSSDEDKTPESSSSEKPVSGEEPTSSKVTSLPDYYEGRY